MKASYLLMAGLVAAGSASYGQKGPKPVPPPEPGPAPVVIAPGSAPAQPPAAPSSGTFVYDQKPMNERYQLVTREQAESIINRFRDAYPKLGNPRFVIYVNRDLVDEESGLKLSARKENTESIQSSADKAVGLNSSTNGVLNGQGRIDRVENKNTYRVRDRKEHSLADKQTTRDVEMLFSRPLRMAGASMADQRVAAQLLEGKSVSGFLTQTSGDQARKDREALGKIADVVIEVLIASRNVPAPGISGDRIYTTPDIQATAIRLSDAKVLGQASTADLLGGDRVRVARNFTTQQVTEATGLALMEDMLR